jgi:uncharacterized protein
MPSTCPTCGAAAPEGAAFCSTCGATLGAAAPPPTAPVPAGPAGPAAPAGPLDSETRNLGLLAHLSALVAFAGIPSFLGPLVVWLWQRDRHPFVAEQAREALNFNLSVLLYTVIGGVVATVVGLATLGIGLVVVIPVAIALGIAWVAVVVIAGLAASRGEGYRYPITIRFVS